MRRPVAPRVCAGSARHRAGPAPGAPAAPRAGCCSPADRPARHRPDPAATRDHAPDRRWQHLAPSHPRRSLPSASAAKTASRQRVALAAPARPGARLAPPPAQSSMAARRPGATPAAPSTPATLRRRLGRRKLRPQRRLRHAGRLVDDGFRWLVAAGRTVPRTAPPRPTSLCSAWFSARLLSAAALRCAVPRRFRHVRCWLSRFRCRRGTCRHLPCRAAR